jgi:hypothetical protein
MVNDMARTGLLSPLFVQRATKAGRYGDGGGLYLQVRHIGTETAGQLEVSKTWLFRYAFERKPKAMSLGAFSTVNSLAAMRKRAEGLRALLDQGIDPQAQRETDRQKRIEED